MKERTLDGGPKGGVERRAKRGRVNLTQYLESQEDQDMTRLLNFTRTQEKRREGDFLSSPGCLVSGKNNLIHRFKI